MPPDLARLPDALHKLGVTVVEYEGWRTRGYDTVDFIGQLNHHTAISGPCSPSTAAAMVRGRSDLEGPLCNAHGGLDGHGRFVVYLIAARRARHAGPGSQVVYNEYLRDVHDDRTALQRGLADDPAAHGNRSLFGWEWQHPGDSSPWPPELLGGIGRCNAALAELAGWAAKRSKGHKHWTRRKIDPSWTGSLPALTQAYLVGDPMATLDADDIKAIGAEVSRQLAAVFTGTGQTTDEASWDRLYDNSLNAALLLKQIKAAVDGLGAGGGTVDVSAQAKAMADELATRLRT